MEVLPERQGFIDETLPSTWPAVRGLALHRELGSCLMGDPRGGGLSFPSRRGLFTDGRTLREGWEFQVGVNQYLH